MRKEAKQTKSIELARVQRYHEGGYSVMDEEQYACLGFKQNKYFTSDRFMPLDDHFNRPDGKPLQGYGIEIETECNGIKTEAVLAEVYDKIIFSHFPADLFKMQHDSSLRGYTSAECITQVMTKAFVRNNYRNFRLMWNTYFPAFDIRTDSACTGCGMHVNVSNACFGRTEKQQEEAIRKLYYFINKHYNLACKLFYRAGDTHYCRQMQYENAKTMNLHDQDCSHGVCFNLGHYNAGRVEIRLVGGQKDYFCFRNTMECVFFLVEHIGKVDWDKLDDMTEVFKGCNQYVYKRLSTECGLPAHVLENIHSNMEEENLGSI